jgi:hypothetical protein
VRLNVSQVLEWMKCQQSWHNKFVARRANPPGETLGDGTFFHETAHAALKPLLQIETSEGGVGGGVGREARRDPRLVDSIDISGLPDDTSLRPLPGRWDPAAAQAAANRRANLALDALDAAHELAAAGRLDEAAAMEKIAGLTTPSLADIDDEVERLHRAGRVEEADAVRDLHAPSAGSVVDDLGQPIGIIDLVPDSWKSPAVEMNDERAAMSRWISSGALAAALADYEILELETPRSIRLGDHDLVGTPDGVLRQRQTGALWLLQYKTVSGYRPIDVLMDEVRISWYECAYEAMVRAAYPGERIGGTLLAGWRKLTKKARSAGDEAFVLLPISRTPAEVDRALGELRSIADEIAAATPTNLRWNRRSCTQYNYRCQYFDVCHGSLDLSAAKFVDVEDRYAAFEGGGDAE